MGILRIIICELFHKKKYTKETAEIKEVMYGHICAECKRCNEKWIVPFSDHKI